MKENKYDNDNFFNKYKQMPRSVEGLKAAGEWHVLKQMLPSLSNKRVLDLGCGFGWHCRYAVEQGAQSVVGIDISEKMLNEAKKNTDCKAIEYIQMPIEDIHYPVDTFDLVISSLALHYVEPLEEVFHKINNCLVSGGHFVFSVENPIFTANEKQDWYTDEAGNLLHWPVDNYFYEGIRETNFLGEKVLKYHRMMTTYINTLVGAGFEIVELIEPKPEPKMLEEIAGMQHELRRPMFLIISARKK